MPSKSANVKNEKQYEELKEKGMSKERAAKFANSPGASSHGGKKSGSRQLNHQAGRDDGAEEGRRPQGRQGDRPRRVNAVSYVAWAYWPRCARSLRSGSSPRVRRS